MVVTEYSRAVQKVENSGRTLIEFQTHDQTFWLGDSKFVNKDDPNSYVLMNDSLRPLITFAALNVDSALQLGKALLLKHLQNNK